MRTRGESGIWEIFIPELAEGSLYKFEIFSRVGDRLAVKSDPYAVAAELRPNTASIVANLDAYAWNDSEWLKARASRDWGHSPSPFMKSMRLLAA